MPEKREPRLEAGVLRPAELTDEQQGALGQVIDYLRGMAEAEYSPALPDSQWRFLPTVDRQRRNQVFLIDGERGSGKSALLVTLLHILTNALRGNEPAADYKVDLGAGHGIVPVGLVDLQPIDPQTNLLLHLVGQLAPLVEVIHEQTAARESGDPSDLWSSAGEPACKSAWRTFVQAATAAWDAQLTQRKPHLDLEELAVEVERVERRRLDLPRAFTAFVDALVRDYARWQKLDDMRAPLFVIAIDDADMNPHKARELLELLRTLWHERVAFVLTGDSELFLDTIEANLREARGQQAQRVSNERLARSIYDKIVPEPHRLLLPELTREQRVAVLERVLARKGDDGTDPASALLALVDRHGAAAEAIPGRLREIRDLAMALERDRESVPAMLCAWMDFAIRASSRHELPFHHTLSAGEPEGGPVFTIQARSLGWRIDTRDTHMLKVPVGGLMVARSAELRFLDIRDPDADEPYLHVVTLTALAELAGHATRVVLRTEAAVAPAWVRAYIRSLRLVVPWELPAWESWQRAYRATRHFCEFVTRQLEAGSLDPHRCALAHLMLAARSFQDQPAPLDLEPLDDESWSRAARELLPLVGALEHPAGDEWARKGALYLAAPESGLPFAIANRWLRAYRSETAARIAWDTLVPELRSLRAERLGRNAVERVDEICPRHELFALDQEPTLSPELEGTLSSIELPRVPEVSDGSIYYGHLANALKAIPARIRNLAAAPAQLQQALADVFKRYTVRGSSVSALHEAWSCAMDAYPDNDVHALVRKVDGRIHLHLDVSLQCEEERVLTLRQGARLTLTRAGYPRIDNLPDDVPPELDALLRVLFDALVDTRDGEPDDSLGVGISPIWPFLALEDSRGVRHLPAPAWRSLFDWEVMTTDWNRTLDSLLSMDLSSDPDMPGRVYRGLLFWYIGYVFDVYYRRGKVQSLTLDLGHRDWTRLDSMLTPHLQIGELENDDKRVLLALLSKEQVLRSRLTKPESEVHSQQYQSVLQETQQKIARFKDAFAPESHRQRAFFEWSWAIWQLLRDHERYCLSPADASPALEAFTHILESVRL